MQLMRSLSSRFSSMSVKVEEFRIRKHGANEFAEYKITVWEGSAQYSVWRRWSDLKEAYEALEKDHAKEMKKKQIPAFEAHSMRLGAAHLDPEYLAKRQKTMDALLKKISSAFDVSVEHGKGPESFRRFLAPSKYMQSPPIRCPMPRCKCLRAIDKCAVDPKAADPRAGAKLAGQAFLMVAACALVGLSVKTYVEQMVRATAEWPSATCAVVDANVTAIHNRNRYSTITTYRADVRVVMDTFGDPHRCMACPRPLAHRWGHPDLHDAEEDEITTWMLLAGIQEGADVPCWYDPSDPERVKLSDARPPLVAVWIMLTVCLLALCCLVPLMLWMISMVYEMYQTAYRQMPDDDDGATGAAKNDKTAVAVKMAPPLNRELSAKLDEVKAVVKPRTVQRSNSHFFHVGDLPPAVDVRLRHAFLRKVYGIVLAQVVLTAAVACGIMYSDTVSEWSIRHFGWMSWVAFIATLLLLFACAIYKNSYPHNYCLLFGFTLCQAYSIGVVCAMYRSVGLEETLLQAFVLTASLFILLTLFTIQSKINFSFLGAGLYGALWLLIVTGILALWLHYEWLRTAYALAGSLLFCVFIIYDTYLITSKLGYDDYIIAAIELYLDVVNLFLFLLSLLSSKN